MEADLKITGLDEFTEKISLVEKKAPDRILNRLEKEAKETKKLAKRNSPDGHDMEKKRSKKLKNSWKSSQVIRTQGDYQVEIWSKAPHFHLMERPHVYVVGSLHNRRVVGYHPGLFFFKRTIEGLDVKFQSEREGWLNELYEELKG